VRNRSDVASNTLRKPEILPHEEVRVAIAEVVEENYGAERDQLVQAVARLFGFSSTSAQLREVVETALTDLLDAGRLRFGGVASSRERSRKPRRLNPSIEAIDDHRPVSGLPKPLRSLPPAARNSITMDTRRLHAASPFDLAGVV